MKLTLLDMVQNILSALDSDEVNSVSDTTESRQIAEIIKSVYFDIAVRADLPEHYQTFSLTPSNDLDAPVIMYKPDHVGTIKWIKYNGYDLDDDTEPNYRYINIVPIEQFLDMTNFNTEESYVDSFTYNDQVFYFRNDHAPNNCVIMSDSTIIFDAYDSEVDSTLQETKTLCWGQVLPVFNIEDTFIPNLDDKQFPLLLNEAKTLAFLELKQTAHDYAIRQSKRHWSSLQRNKELVKGLGFNDLPDFGRRGRVGRIRYR